MVNQKRYLLRIAIAFLSRGCSIIETENEISGTAGQV